MIAFDSEARVLNPPSTDRGMLNALVGTELTPGDGGTRYAAAFSALEKVSARGVLARRRLPDHRTPKRRDGAPAPSRRIF